MEYQLPSTFIPRKAAQAEAVGVRHARVSVFFGVSMVAFVMALFAALGVFAYQKILVSRLQKMNDDLVAARVAFEPEFIYELERMDERLASTRTLLAGHRALSPLFALLERETLATVRFVKFSAVEGESGFRVELDGEATGFNAAALQSDIFSKNPHFLNPVFSDFDVNKTGLVSFRFTANLTPEFTRYRTHLAARSATPASQSPPPASSADRRRPAEEAGEPPSPASEVPLPAAVPPAPPAGGEGFGGGDILF